MTREEARNILRNKSCVDCVERCAYPLENPEGYCEYADAISTAIEALKEQRTGKWIYNPYYVCYECSECGEQALEKFTVNERTLDRDYDEVLSKFCPYCGSRMVEVEDEEDEW